MNPFPSILDVDWTNRLICAALDVAVVAIVVFCICAVLRPRSARVRSLLWLLVPVKGLASLLTGSAIVLGLPSIDPEPAPAFWAAHAKPLVTIDSAPPPAATAPVQASAVVDKPVGGTIATVDDAFEGSLSVGDVLALAWILGMAVLTALSVRDRIRGMRLVRRSKPGLPGWRAIVDRHAAAFRVRAPEVRRTTALESPALVGVLRPVILIPHWMDAEAGVEWAIRHELMHVAMRDPWAALVRELGRIAFFFHPAVWYAGRKWEEAAELACDRALVCTANESIDYADRLHALARRICHRHDVTLAHGLFAARSRVGKRIEALLDARAGRARLSRWTAAAVGLLFAATLAAGSGTVLFSDFVFRGTVSDHEGKPVAGAIVVASWRLSDEPAVELARTQTDAGGRFELGYDRADLPPEPNDYEAWKRVAVSAHASNHGPDWVIQRDLKSLEGIALRLAPEFPLEGRLVDEDGQPLRGASLRVDGIRTVTNDSLDAWLASLADGGSKSTRYLLLPEGQAPTAITDDTGAFVLRGVGAERICWFSYKGGDAALGRASMATRVFDRELMDKIDRRKMEPVHPAGSTVVAERTRPVEGVVVDAVSGEPVAGVDVYNHMPGPHPRKHELHAKTDSKGRFRLLGMSRNGGQIAIVPRSEEPYFMREFGVRGPKAPEPIELRIPLNKGVWITGVVVDGTTGKPGRGTVTYHPHRSNPLVPQIDQFKDGRTDSGYPCLYRTAPDGTFRIPALPGRGLVGVEAFGPYRQGAGYEARWEGGFVSDGWTEPSPAWPTAMALVEIAPDARAVEVKLTLEAGTTRSVTVLDAAGQRVTNYEAARSGWYNIKVRNPGDGTFEALNLAPGEKRLVQLRLPDNSAGLVARLCAGETEPTLTLQKSATIKGSLIDQDGVPLNGRWVHLFILPEDVPTFVRATTDASGTFQIDGVLTGCDYRLQVNDTPYPRTLANTATVVKSLAVRPGETVDLAKKTVKLP